MYEEEKVQRKFKPGDFVFGKLKDYSPWPGKIDSNLGEKYRYKYKVFFYGTNKTAYLTHKNIYPYDEFKDKFWNANKTIDFVKAISELEFAQTKKSKENSQEYDSATPPFVSENEVSYGEQNILNEKDLPECCEKKRKEKTKKIKNGEIKHKRIKADKEPKNNTISSMKRKLYSDSSFKNISKIPKISKKTELKDDDFVRQLDNDIKCSLSISEPNVEKCTDLLNRLISFNFDDKLLLKYPEIISTIKKVRKYKGSKEVRELADEVMEKLKDVCRSLHSSEFSRIFQTTRVISEKPKSSKEPEIVKQENPPKTSESLNFEEKNRIRINETIAQIIHESTVRLPELLKNSSTNNSNSLDERVVGSTKNKLDEFEAYTNAVNDEDIHNMLGV